jgi:uncharacterized protein (DUF2141 family)
MAFEFTRGGGSCQPHLQFVVRARRVLTRLGAGLVLLLLLFAGHAEAARLVVTIEGLHSAAGHVYVALFSKADNFPDGNYSFRHRRVRATNGPLTVVFDDIPPGVYAAGAYHDEDDNQKMDTNFFGYPLEGYALSNDIRAVLSRPRFTDAAFQLGGEEGRIVLHIKY